MKAKTKFMKMYYKLPKEARTMLIFGYPNHPMTLGVVLMEIKNNTVYGNKILECLGYKDDKR